MLTLIWALALGGITFAASFFTIGLIPAIFPTIIVILGSYFFLAKKVAREMEGKFKNVQATLQRGRFDLGINELIETKKAFGHKQFFIKSAIDGQIGTIYFLRKDFKRAKPYLETSFSRHWVAKAMLAVLHYRKKEVKAMDAVLDKATRYAPKQGLLWSLWAFMHHKMGDNKKAIDVLLKGKNKLGESDQTLLTNLMALQNNKKMKMKAYGEQWYQFHLEVPVQMRQAQKGGVRFARR